MFPEYCPFAGVEEGLVVNRYENSGSSDVFPLAYVVTIATFLND